MTPDRPTTATPPLHRQVTLALPGLEEVPARVMAKGEDFTELALLARPRTPLLDHSDAFLEFLTDDGMWRMLGTIRLQATDHGEALRFEYRGRTQLLQRRAYVRTECIAAVFVTADGGPPQRGLTLNLSGGGLLVRGLDANVVELGVELGFDLRLDLLPARIQGRCRVVRRTPDGCHGMQFTEIDEGDRDRLGRFAYQREKSAREARLGY